MRFARARAGLALLLLCAFAPAAAAEDLFDTSRLRIGIGDRITRWSAGEGRSVALEARARGLRLDFLQVWLPRGWQDSWIPPAKLAALARGGVVPVVVHYWFGDDISRERVEAQRAEWYTSLWRMAQRLRGPHPVLVVLEPEFNVAPPGGETHTLDWPGFGYELAAAARLVKREAPNVRVGVCPGDFPGPPRLEPVLTPALGDLDFLAFQEMRAVTDPRAREPGYLDVGRAAREYATYLHRAFDKPILLAYVAVSSHGGWEDEQSAALQDLARHRDALREAGVFGAIYFQLFDDPEHKGYFGPAETSFGLLDPTGRPKPAFATLRSLARRRVPLTPGASRE